MTPTVDELIARADELRPRLVEQQAETEERTYYSQEIHEEFLEAGFYRMLVPKRYGGLELDLGSFWRVIIAVARGCPSTAWCLCLAAGHALQTGDAVRGGGAGGAVRRRALPLPGGRRAGGQREARRRRLGADEHARLLVGRAVRDALHGPDVRGERRPGRAARADPALRRAARRRGRCSTTGATRSA